jgi:hypothetical protein
MTGGRGGVVSDPSDFSGIARLIVAAAEQQETGYRSDAKSLFLH